MDRLLVNTKELKPEYEKRDFLWINIYCKFCLMYARVWKTAPLVHYPLTIDIRFGTMRYHYYKHGLKYVLSRILNYNKVMVDKIKGISTDIDPEDFHIRTLLTDAKSINDQLNKEMLDYV